MQQPTEKPLKETACSTWKLWKITIVDFRATLHQYINQILIANLSVEMYTQQILAAEIQYTNITNWK